MTDKPAADPALEKASMKEQRDRFLAFAFASADLFLEISGEGRVIFAVGAARGVTGIDEKSLVGRKWLELFSVYEQATMISTWERAKAGMRLGPVLVNLSDALGARKAIMTAIRMPTSDKFYITLGLSSAIMARIAHAVSQSQGFEILTRDPFIEACQGALKRSRATGQELSFTFFDFAPTRLERTRMGEGPWMKMREALAEFLIAEAFDGYTAGEINDGRFSIVHDRRVATNALHEKMTRLTKANDPSGGGLTIKVKTLTVDIRSLPERDAETAVTFTVSEFGKKGVDELNYASLNAAYKAYISASTPRVKEFQSLLERSAFSLYFQPIVDLKANAAAHFEMFCHFENGTTRDWVKFAQDVGMSADLDKAMYERAINHVKFKAGGTWTKFSVNLSVRSLDAPAFVDEFLERMESRKELAERLLFEMADTPFARDPAKLAEFIANIKDLGFRVALDHFSPEPGAADMLEKLKPDMVKIDGRYVRRILTSQRDSGLLRTLSEICQAQEIQTVGKWVEERAQADALLEMGIPFAQGFYFGRPGPKPDYIPPKD